MAHPYRAFLSYSHADTRWSKWLHRRLEGFRIDRELVGRETPAGLVPARLAPIFRDRDEFTAGETLSEQTVAALDASAALIVLCSPAAARSRYVDEEVRLFRSRHPDRPVIPVIAEGTPGDAERECFPSALRYDLDAEACVTQVARDVLAADLRDTGDGSDLALAKVVARLLGLATDDVFRRQQREQRRQARVRLAVGLALLVMLAGAGSFAWLNYSKERTLREIEALVARYAPVSEAQAAVPDTREELTQAITAIAQGAATDPRYRQALALLKAGKPGEAEPLLKAVAEAKAGRARKDAEDAAEAYRNLGSIAAVSDPRRARQYYEEAARLDPASIEGALQDAWYEKEAGALDAAETAYRRVLALGKPGADDERLVWAHLGLGDIAVGRGELDGAAIEYRQARSIVEPLAAADPDNRTWQRDLSASAVELGDIDVRLGQLGDALQNYKIGLTINDKLAAAEPANAGAQRDLAVVMGKVGRVLELHGDDAAALASYRADEEIAARLAAADPTNVVLQRDLAATLTRIGNVALHTSAADALPSYNQAAEILERLVAADPDNASLKFDLAVTLNQTGNAQIGKSDSVAARAVYGKARDIGRALAAVDPRHTLWQRTLANSEEGLGLSARLAANVDEATAAYRAALAIYDALLALSPDDAELAQLPVVPLRALGELQGAAGRPQLEKALALLKAAQAKGALDARRTGWIAEIEAELAAPNH